MSAGESYLQHMRFALMVGFVTVGAGLACVIHALVPSLCERTCSRTLGQLSLLFSDRGRLRHFEREASGVFTFIALILLASATAMIPAALGGGWALIATIALLAFAIPFTFLSTNPELEPVEEMAGEPRTA
ncbi:MAG TPA: DUF6356 family protein [Sphingomicrobium sp.]|nr:DUF6356 family protein [Sphingomicrobium sp.]